MVLEAKLSILSYPFMVWDYNENGQNMHEVNEA